jgi:tetratricopeptide (TPR) repeat protein
MHYLMKSRAFWTALPVLLFLATPAHALTSLKVDQQQVDEWNRFATRLFALHERQMQKYETYKKSSSGGYATHPDLYRQVSYYNKTNDKLLSRLQWEKDNPERLHSIAVYVYDEQGDLQRDYLAAYLPKYRNAPVQTLINIHFSDKELRAFRQFDASGNRIYEQCRGQYFGEPFTISLEEHEIPSIAGHMPKYISAELYRSCFSEITSEADQYLDPLNGTSGFAQPAIEVVPITEKIRRLDQQIKQQPGKAELYVQRARHWMTLQEFGKAISDLDVAVQLDETNNQAYFWRGMALGRNGQVERGIEDLTVYIERIPDSSLAYTKRGIRYVWISEVEKARQDFLKALELDNRNAEAHDDLGVIYAQQGEMDRAMSHFKKVIELEPDYHKAYHNLAMAHHIQDKNFEAYQYINKALTLKPSARSSMMLKAEILAATGKEDMAREIRSEARFMPQDNWTEVWPD